MEHVDDPVTLMRVVALIAIFMALAWITGIAVLRIQTGVAQRFAAGNLLFAIGVFLTSQRLAYPLFLTYQGADFTELLGMTLLRTGMQRYSERPITYTEHFVVLAAAGLSTVMLAAQPNSLAQMGVAFSFAAGWIALRTFGEMLAQLKQDSRVITRVALLWPLAGFGLLMLVRGLYLVIVRDPALVDVNLRSPAIVAMFWVIVTVLLATNASFIGLVVARLIARISEMSQRDSLTGVHNHRATMERITMENRRQKRGGPAFSIAMLDLDHFKQVNDRYGHACGDAALRHVTRTIAPLLRVTDNLGRVGGEEFMLVLPMTELAGALIATERIRSKLASTPLEWHGSMISLTASFGVAQSHDSEESCETLMQRADEALYRSKSGGRNRVEAAYATIAANSPLA